MDPTLILVAAGILLVSVVLSTGIERLIRRLNVQPEDLNGQSRGFRDVLSRIDRWQRSTKLSRTERAAKPGTDHSDRSPRHD